MTQSDTPPPSPQSTPQSQPDNPLHGITLKTIVETLVEQRGWDDLADQIPVRCFAFEPSIKSALKFLRKTDWARSQVEALYLRDKQARDRNTARNQKRKQRRLNKQSDDNCDAALHTAETETTTP